MDPITLQIERTISFKINIIHSILVLYYYTHFLVITNLQFEKFFSRQTNETTLIRDTGFTKRKLDDVHPSQIAEMSRKCR